jgi:two-component system chemotaxis response regulator CheY
MDILIVDDSRTMRMIVKRTLRQAGFGSHSVREAENGHDALNQIKTKKPDLILCDWNMPVMTGIELLNALNDARIRVKFGFVT